LGYLDNLLDYSGHDNYLLYNLFDLNDLRYFNHLFNDLFDWNLDFLDAVDVA
jgi:hypothetical protein